MSSIRNKKELYVFRNGRAVLVEDEDFLKNNDEVAEVASVIKNGKVISKDMFIPKSNWITYEDYCAINY